MTCRSYKDNMEFCFGHTYAFCLSKNSEYDQEIPQLQSQTADKPMATITRHQKDKLSKATTSLNTHFHRTGLYKLITSIP